MTSARTLLLPFLLLLVAAPLAAAENPLTAIQDNSFLVEEAYNQEEGVVQHISFFMRDRRSGAWNYTFTQEWPAPSQKHQLSYTIAYAADRARGLGDAALNYRYQLIGSGESTLAVAPRASLILPTGSEPKGLGRGEYGLQVNLPVSRVIASRLVSHTNVGGTVYRHGRGDIALGQSLIYAATDRIHLMAEATWTRAAGESQTLVSPGIRWAHNLSRGLQVVPGIAFPMGSHQRSVVGYLSFEHPFR